MIKELMYYFFKFFRKRVVIVGAPAIIINEKGEILLGKRNGVVFYNGFWGLPGGIVEYGETIDKAIKRELKEELNVEIKILKYGKPKMNLPNKECPLQTLDVPVYCKIIKNKPTAKSETSKISWFSPKKIKKLKLAYSHKELLKQEKLI
jgi:mutator protein MutT